MRLIKRIIIHCSATVEGEHFTVKDIRRWHVEGRGWSDIGYHQVVLLDGTVQPGRPIERIGAHTKGMNNDSIGVCYVGGIDKDRKPKDTRTSKQKESLISLIKDMLSAHPDIEEIKGHRDYSPDLNHDGAITPDEWMKSCPCFDVETEYKIYL